MIIYKANIDIKEYLNRIKSLCDHDIPFYAYGDNEAAVRMSDLLENIQREIDNLNAEIFKGKHE